MNVKQILAAFLSAAMMLGTLPLGAAAETDTIPEISEFTGTEMSVRSKPADDDDEIITAETSTPVSDASETITVLPEIVQETPVTAQPEINPEISASM